MNDSPEIPTKPPWKPRQITVAPTPTIGNYQLPPLDFLQDPGPMLKPTESKEELMANACLMQQTPARFDIEVSLGGITRYELHSAPGVKLGKITALIIFSPAPPRDYWRSPSWTSRWA